MVEEYGSLFIEMSPKQPSVIDEQVVYSVIHWPCGLKLYHPKPPVLAITRQQDMTPDLGCRIHFLKMKTLASHTYSWVISPHNHHV